MGGHKKMQADHSGGGTQTLCNFANGKTGTVARENGLGIRAFFQFRKQGLLDIKPFRNAFNHQIHVRPIHLVQGTRKGKQMGAVLVPQLSHIVCKIIG